MTLLILLGVALATPPVVADGATIEVGPVDGALVIHASSTRLNLEESKGWLKGDVRATRGDLSLTATEAEVTLGQDGAIERAVARGDVTVRQGEHKATGQQAVMEGETLTLTGGPVLTSPQHRMQGSEMVFQVGAKTVRCTECTVVVEDR